MSCLPLIISSGPGLPAPPWDRTTCCARRLCQAHRMVDAGQVVTLANQLRWLSTRSAGPAGAQWLQAVQLAIFCACGRLQQRRGFGGRAPLAGVGRSPTAPRAATSRTGCDDFGRLNVKDNRVVQLGGGVQNFRHEAAQRTSKVMLVPRPVLGIEPAFIMSGRLRRIDKPRPVPGGVAVVGVHLVVGLEQAG